MTAYLNDDGLHILFGTDRAKPDLVGSPQSNGEDNVMIAEIDWERLGAVATSTPVNLMPLSALPSGALLKSATLEVTEAFTSGGAATLDIGVRTSEDVAIDPNGIDVAIALAAIGAVGDTVVCNGALIGTVLAGDSFLETTVGTAAYTAGKARLVIKYFVPRP